jgi:hypothetical protein
MNPRQSLIARLLTPTVDNARHGRKAHSFRESRLQVKNIINNKGVDGADSSFGQWPVTVRGRAGRLVIGRSRPEPR